MWSFASMIINEICKIIEHFEICNQKSKKVELMYI